MSCASLVLSSLVKYNLTPEQQDTFEEGKIYKAALANVQNKISVVKYH